MLYPHQYLRNVCGSFILSIWFSQRLAQRMLSVIVPTYYRGAVGFMSQCGVEFCIVYCSYKNKLKLKKVLLAVNRLQSVFSNTYNISNCCKLPEQMNSIHKFLFVPTHIHGSISWVKRWIFVRYTIRAFGQNIFSFY